MKFSAALDLSGDEVCLALAREDGEFLLNINQPMHGRDSANLAKFVNSQLQAAQVDLADLVDLEDLAVSMIYLISLLVVENLVNNLKVVAKIFKLQLLLHLKKLASAVRKI